MIYLVEDDDNIRKLVSYALSKDGYEVRGFGASHELWEELINKLPDLVLLDIMLPDEDGLSVLERLRNTERTKDIPVIMLTARGSEYDKVMGLDMGADDYIAKPFGMTELSARINAVLRRYQKSKTDEECYNIDSLYVNLKKHIVKVSGEIIELSLKEYELLCALLRSDGGVVSRDKLLSCVWGEYYDESRTLDVHIRKLRVKLGEAGELIKTVKGVGYRIGGKNDEQ